MQDGDRIRGRRSRSTRRPSGWDRRAPTYSDFIGNLTNRLVDPLLAAAGVRSGSRVLDLATGPGCADTPDRMRLPECFSTRSPRRKPNRRRKYRSARHFSCSRTTRNSSN
jgi:hypothetical protein